MKLEEIKKLAELSRIEMTEEEMLEINKDFEPILAYVGQIQDVANLSENSDASSNVLLNVIREDIVTNEPSSNTEKIIKEMPESQDGFLKVKQIL